MNTTHPPPVNQKIVSGARQMLAKRRAQGERWRRAGYNAERELAALWINPDAAWRRWENGDALAEIDR